MAFKFKRQRRFPIDIPLPSIGRRGDTPDPETLVGEVQGFQASAPEERLAKALDKSNISYRFRVTAGAPRGLPGWKEVDFIISVNGLLYAVEVDTAFTHRGKEMADVLHDAIILNDPYLQQMGQFYPQVFHADGDSDLATFANAHRYVKTAFGVSHA